MTPEELRSVWPDPCFDREAMVQLLDHDNLEMRKVRVSCDARSPVPFCTQRFHLLGMCLTCATHFFIILGISQICFWPGHDTALRHRLSDWEGNCPGATPENLRQRISIRPRYACRPFFLCWLAVLSHYFRLSVVSCLHRCSYVEELWTWKWNFRLQIFGVILIEFLPHTNWLQSSTQRWPPKWRSNSIFLVEPS